MTGGSITIRRGRPEGEPTPPPDPPGDERLRLAQLAPAFLLLATAIVLNVFEGGYGRSVWGAVALFVLALFLLVLLLAPPARRERSKAFDAGVLCLGLLTLWSYASMLWADVPGDAWEGANRTLLYWLAFTTIGLRPWPVGPARAALGLVGIGTAVLAIGVLVATVAGDAASLFVGGRLSEPVGYANALANAWLIAFFPAIHLAIAREHPWPVRALGLGAAVLLLQMALLSQSRGAVIAFVATVVVFLVMHPRHWPALAAIGFSVLVLFIGWDVLTEVRNSANAGQLDDTLGDARGWIALSTAGAMVAGALAAVLGRELGARGLSSPRTRRTADRAFLGLAGAGAATVVVALALSGGWIDARWDDFKNTGYATVDDGSTRFGGSLGSGRYDYYRVAVNEFRDHPITGIGAENFAGPYLQQRRTVEAPRYTHSLGFGFLVQLGAVGTLLLAGFLVACCTPFVTRRRRWTPAERGVAVGAFGGFVAFFTHGMGDWLWEYPALSIVALGLLAIATRTGEPDVDVEGRGGGARWPLASLPARALVGLLAVAAAVSFALPGAAARLERSAAEVSRTDPTLAMARLERASTIDRLSADPLIGRSIIARSLGRRDESRANLQEALRREPENWYAHFELALLEGQAGAFAEARRQLDLAAALNPRQPLIGEVRDLILQRKRVDPVQVERALSGQLSVRLTPFDSE